MTTVAKLEPSIKELKSVNILSHVRYEHLVAGISGGVMSTLVLQPLDVIKIRFAANDGRSFPTMKYNSIVNAFTTITRTEGLYGLYRGVNPNCWGAGSSWGLYFLFYNTFKTWEQKRTGLACLGPLEHSVAAAMSGALTLVLTNPLWVVKTRLCLQQDNQYKGMIDAFRKIYKAEGIRGYYRGFLPGLFGVTHGAVQFVSYEEMKKLYIKYNNLPSNDQLGVTQYLTFAALSKIIAAIATYPYQVLRTRLQNQFCSYDGTIDCILRTYNFEGLKGFYKGLGTNLIRVTPATMITFVTYENVSYFLLKFKKDTVIIENK